MSEFKLRGLIIFVSDVWGLEYMYLYTATKWRGKLIDCDEGELVWLDKRELLTKKLREGDKLFLKALDEREEFFMMKFRYFYASLVERMQKLRLNGLLMACGLEHAWRRQYDLLEPWSAFMHSMGNQLVLQGTSKTNRRLLARLRK